jgi:hypothetical protein
VELRASKTSAVVMVGDPTERARAGWMILRVPLLTALLSDVRMAFWAIGCVRQRLLMPA